MQQRLLTTTQVFVPLNSSNTLHNHIHVSVRLKPIAESEQQLMKDKRGQWLIPNENTIQDRHAREQHQFHFDRVFGPHVTTEDIFSQNIIDMMKNALKGYNVSILAYGQTNSGKTFTINGGKDQRGQWQPGIVHLTASELFNMLEFMQSPEGIEQEMREKADSSFHSQGNSGAKAAMKHFN